MIHKNITVKINPALGQGSCTLPREIFMSLGYPHYGRKITLSAGNKQADAVVAVKKLSPVERKMILISPDLGAKLHLPLGVELNLNILTDNRGLRMGPFIGIYGYKNLTGGRIFSEQTAYFRKICSMARGKHAIAYVISADDPDLEKGFTYGHILTKAPKENQWVKVPLPLPDVWYDRGLFPKGPGKNKSRQVRRYLRETWADKFFNPKFFDKWRTHQWISKHPVLRKHLPTTVHIKRFEIAEKLVNHYPSLYLKPSGGSSGRGIIRLRKTSGKLIAECIRKKRHYIMEYRNFAELWQDLSAKALVNNTYILQEDLDLAKYQGQPFDVRALMQKDGHGEWTLTGMAARISGVNGIITNLHAGGKAEKIETVLISVFDPATAKHIESEIKGLCFATCRWVEEVSGLKFGEIAVDIGLNKKGKPYLIELNAVPGRTIFTKIKEQGLRQVALSRPIEYALFLAGFTTNDKEDRS